MNQSLKTPSGSIVFIPHGGGPLPVLGEPGHQLLIDFLQQLPAQLIAKPAAILVISAHWEAEIATITSGPAPTLLYDYGGFPSAAYQIKYPAPGHPPLAKKIFQLLQDNGIATRLDPQRGFDHGLFIPLKLMFPAADIPCLQLSLVQHLDPQLHWRLGKALQPLLQDKVLIIGSGFSFHNLSAFFTPADSNADLQNSAFENWLIETCTDSGLSRDAREERLINWRQAPFARYCHPRAEHLLPLHVCAGLADSDGKLVFDGQVLGKKTSAFLW